MSSLRTGNTGNSDSEAIMQKSKARILKTYFKFHTELELLIIYYYYIAKIYEILTKCSLNNIFFSHNGKFRGYCPVLAQWPSENK